MDWLPYTHAQSRAGGVAAHAIHDFAIEPKWFEGGVLYGGAPVWVLTPRFGWHPATDRERGILRALGLPIWPSPL
jgi:hypothetical protein